MSKVKTISTYNGSAWGTEYPIGADAINVDITSATTNPSDSETTVESLLNNDIVVGSGDTDATAWSKFNKARNRIANILDNFDTGGGGSASSITFNITLTGGNTAWDSFTQTISNANFLTGNYWYEVAPDPQYYLDYSTYGVRALDVTTANQMVFLCEDVPPSDIIVHIVRTSTEG